MSLRVRRFLATLAFASVALGAAAADESRVIYPGASTASATQSSSGGLGAVTVLGAVVLAAAGGWMLMRNRKLPFANREARKLAIEETRSLGSRQYLVVASYEGKKLLLGVCPGRIDLLTPLDAPTTREPAR